MDFRIRAFVSVARQCSFTKAARELCISQPAVSKHIKELEASLGVQLFERAGNRITLSAAGEIVLKHCESIIESYRLMQLDINLLTGNFKGVLRVGASSTVSQYVLPSIIAKFIVRYPDIRLTMLSGNSQEIEKALSEHKIDLALVEGDSRSQGFRYLPFMRDELVLVTSIANRVENEISILDFARLPFVFRELGSGTLEVVENNLRAHGLKISDLNVLLQLGSTESIKSFLENCTSAYAIVSIVAVVQELRLNRLKVIDIQGLEFVRQFTFVVNQGSQNEIVDRFMEFCMITKSY